eukprot:CAMPEP_0174277670 /NCGR_PEP_ID=MMETSP0439-20130205/61058_1 /TAXON_ID=0 /ORGANISM="Stereomyxa ramosa, Strain Chinc5" /LENGTH=241 /DNA_ID=CAMNT_0015370009 /DNA_START=571 /DNA_END=1296 /DNA_ORIENTATION=-
MQQKEDEFQADDYQFEPNRVVSPPNPFPNFHHHQQGPQHPPQVPDDVDCDDETLLELLAILNSHNGDKVTHNFLYSPPKYAFGSNNNNDGAVNYQYSDSMRPNSDSFLLNNDENNINNLINDNINNYCTNNDTDHYISEGINMTNDMDITQPTQSNDPYNEEKNNNNREFIRQMAAQLPNPERVHLQQEKDPLSVEFSSFDQEAIRKLASSIPTPIHPFPDGVHQDLGSGLKFCKKRSPDH